MLEKYLCMYCNYCQSNWATLLPLAEFVYNHTPSATTGITTFFTNKGYHPNITVHPECELASVHACKFTIDLDTVHCTHQQSMTLTQEYQQCSTNQGPVPHHPT
jgi:hypothetical protein